MDYYTLLCIAAFIIFITSFSRKSNSYKALPKGPPKLPIIGNLHQLNRLTPHRSIHRLSVTYGPIMHLKLGTIPTIVISSPHLAKQILQTHDHLFSSRYLPDTICNLDYPNLSVIFQPVCAKWRNMRKLVVAEIFSHARLDESQFIRSNKIQQMVKHVGENTGRAVDIGFVVFITMINSLSNTLMSDDLADYGSGSSVEFRELVMRSVELVAKPNLSDFFPALKFLDLQGLRRKQRSNLVQLLAIIENIVEQRERSRSTSASVDGSDGDVLDALLRKQSEYEFSSKDIRYLLLDLFLAGADTSSSTVEWAMTELLRNPDKMKKAQSETRSVLGADERFVRESDIPKLKYIQAVVKETFRLHPPGPFLVPRKALADVKIDGFTVPKGSQVLINIWSMGRDSKIWPDHPESFEPERFLESEIEYKGRNFELIPFGAGRRICAGYTLAHRNVNLVLASLIHSFDWGLENGMKAEDIDVNEKFGLSVRKLEPLRAIPILPSTPTNNNI